MSATESELQNELPDVCYAWSKQFGNCADDKIPAGLDGNEVCAGNIKRSHICHFCRALHRGVVCTDEDAIRNHKEREKALKKQRRKWAQDPKERNEEMSSKWAKGGSKGGDQNGTEE